MRKIIEKEFGELESEMSDILNIVEFLDDICENEYVDDYKYKLYILTDLLKQKCYEFDNKYSELYEICKNYNFN